MGRHQSDLRDGSGRVKVIWIGLVVVSLVGLLLLLGVKLFSERSSAVSIGQTPADFTLETYTGDTIHTASLRGNIVLINFWSSWCSTCDEEAIMLEEAWSNYSSKGEKVIFLGVAYMDTESNALAFIETYGMTYPNGPDLRGEISNLYQVSSVPETYILDAAGALREIKIGSFTSTAEIYHVIEQVASGE
ncbi:MAG: TlpA disulfide reductase family protein [Brevefilum sp.]